MRTLGTIYTDYNELFMVFAFQGIKYEIKGLKSITSQVIHFIEWKCS